jgi:hypothetical protein
MEISVQFLLHWIRVYFLVLCIYILTHKHFSINEHKRQVLFWGCAVAYSAVSPQPFQPILQDASLFSSGWRSTECELSVSIPYSAGNVWSPCKGSSRPQETGTSALPTRAGRFRGISCSGIAVSRSSLIHSYGLYIYVGSLQEVKDSHQGTHPYQSQTALAMQVFLWAVQGGSRK